MGRVLVLANANSTLYNFRRELLARLVADGHDVTVALPRHDLNDVFVGLGCRVVETPVDRFGTNPWRELTTLIRTVTIVRRTAPDVVLTYTVKPNIYGGMAAQVCRVPYIATVTGLGAVFQRSGLLQRISALLQGLAFRKASMVFFQNVENAAEFHRRGIVRGQSSVLPGSGVNLSLHCLEPYAQGAAVTRFITVSRIRRDKGYDELFDMICDVSARRSDVEFHVVGWYEDEGYRDTITELEASQPIIFHGEVSQSQVHDLVSSCHALIHPSHHEGMANVVLEASAAGVPSIVSDIPGCREAVEDGATGILVPPRDAGELTRAVDYFMSLPWETRRLMGLGARSKVETEFDRGLVVEGYVAECERVLAAHP